jgi:hypothetical protein
MKAVTSSEGRRHALLEASMSISSELSLQVLLRRLVATAAEPTGARSAALGVIDRSGGGFVLEGMRERASLLDGKLQVESRGGAGMTIVAEGPLR